MKKKKIMIFLGILIVIIVGAIIFTARYFISKSKYDYEIVQVSQIDYNVINVDNRYGVIDRNGNIIVEPKYDIIQIPNPSKAVFICLYDYDVDKKEYKTSVLNEKSEELYTGYDSIQAIPTETTYDNIPYEKTVIKYSKDGKYGLLSIDGKEITKPKYDNISALEYKEGMLLVELDGKKGVININGVTVIKPEYESITADNYYNDQTFYKKAGFIVCKKSDQGYRYGYINYKGDMVLNTEYTEVERVTEIKDDEDIYLVALKDGQAGLLKDRKNILNFEYEDISYNLYNDVFVFQRNGKQGVVDKNGEIKIQPEYESILFGGVYINAKKGDDIYLLDLDGNKIENTDILSKIPTEDGKNSIIVNKDEKYKILDQDGKLLTDKEYSYIEEIGDNKFIATENGKNGIIDISGKTVLDFKYDVIFKIEGTDLLQTIISDTKNISLINKEMKKIVSMDNAKVQVRDGYVKVYSDTNVFYCDYAGIEKTNKELFPDNKLYAKQINKKWGFSDADGNLKVASDYDMVTEFNKYGFAGIKKDGKWGSIDSNGNIVQEPIYNINLDDVDFIGKFYRAAEWYENSYYTDEIQ